MCMTLPVLLTHFCTPSTARLRHYLNPKGEISITETTLVTDDVTGEKTVTAHPGAYSRMIEKLSTSNEWVLKHWPDITYFLPMPQVARILKGWIKTP